MTINPVPLPPSLQPKAVIGKTIIAEETPEAVIEQVPENEEVVTEETPEPEVVVEGKPQLRSDELSDLFEVPQETDNDMYTDDLMELDGEDDLSDLVDVSHEDIMGGEVSKPKQKPRYRIVRRPVRRYIPPAGGMLGLRG